MPRDRQDQLKANYQKLRNAGFSAKEATRYRGASPENIARAIKSKSLPRPSPLARAARTGQKPPKKEVEQYKSYISQWKKDQKIILGVAPREIQKGHIKYSKADHPLIQNYLSNYTYLVAYQVKNADGSIEWKYMTLTSHTPKYKYQLWEEMDDILEGSSSKYDGTVIRSSYGLVAAYTRE